MKFYTNVQMVGDRLSTPVRSRIQFNADIIPRYYWTGGDGFLHSYSAPRTFVVGEDVEYPHMDFPSINNEGGYHRGAYKFTRHLLAYEANGEIYYPSLGDLHHAGKD